MDLGIGDWIALASLIVGVLAAILSDRRRGKVSPAGRIIAGRSINAGGSIWARDSVEAGGSIHARGSIQAGGTAAEKGEES